jgi:two-component system, NtrC family, sensor histidine kinase HydH
MSQCTSLSVATLCALLAFVVFAYSTKKVHKIWAIFNVIVAMWGLAIFLAGMSTTAERALIFWRLTYLPCTFISIVFYHVIAEFCEIRRQRMLSFAYIQGILFALLIIFSDYFVSSTFYVFDSIHYHKATFLFAIWLVLWFVIVASAFVELYEFIKRSQGIQKTQALYLFWGMLLGHTGGAISVIPSFDILIYPAWHFMICIYAAISTYAIFKYQIMDIRVAATRLSIFVLVYSLVLGVPFGLEIWGREWLVENFGRLGGVIPMLILSGFATSGPFIYLYLQRKAEESILKEERRIQDMLVRASGGMNTIHDLNKLLKLIIAVVKRTLRVDDAQVYLLDQEAGRYVPGALLKNEEVENKTLLDDNDFLIQSLKKKNYPLVYDEFRSSVSAENKAASLYDAGTRMLSPEVIVPMTIDKNLLGFLVLGEREMKQEYSAALLNTLSVLGNQAALAIKNCRFWEEETKRMEKEGLQERMVSLDHMASSMAHEIDNPVHIIQQSLGYMKDYLLKDARCVMPKDVKDDFQDSLVQTQKAAERISGMIKAILDYSRMGTGELGPVSINHAVEEFLQLIGPEIKQERVHFVQDVENNLPLVLGDKIQIEEILMNFVSNSLHAVKRKNTKRINLRIFRKNEKTVRIECTDNGYGIPQKLIKDIFLSSTTTKGSSEGTGLGLYRVRKIVDLFKGKVWAESEGQDKGAAFIVELPVYEGSDESRRNQTPKTKVF